MYLTNLTETEKRLGYKISQMPNPAFCHIGGLLPIDAVIYELDETNIIVKVDLQDGNVRYSHQRLGSVSVGHQDNWKAVGIAIQDPAAAIDLARGLIKV